MQLDEFMHVVSAVADVTGHDEFVVIGSQAILGTMPEPPASMLESMEADIFALHDPAAADAIDGALGDQSPFHLAHGYYAHGVGRETATPPQGWEERLVRVDVRIRAGPRRGRMVTAWCLEPHDLVLSKLVAGRDRDWDYAKAALKAQVVGGDLLLARLAELPIPAAARSLIARRITALLD